MTIAEALSRISGEAISNAALAGIKDGCFIFDCQPQQRISVRLTNNMVEIRSDRRNHTLWVGRCLYDAESKCILKAAQCGRKEVHNVPHARS